MLHGFTVKRMARFQIADGGCDVKLCRVAANMYNKVTQSLQGVVSGEGLATHWKEPACNEIFRTDGFLGKT